MLQLLYILAFTVLAVLAIGNLIRNLITLGFGAVPSRSRSSPSQTFQRRSQKVPHPELLDDAGNVIDEPLLVMRSMTVEDAREQLDELYRQSPGSKDESA